MADGEAPATAEREAGRREGGLSGDRDDDVPLGRIGDEPPDQRAETVLVHPPLLDEAGAPADVADGERPAVPPRHHDGAFRGPPLLGAWLQRAFLPPRAAGLFQRLSLAGGRVADLARDHPVHDPVLRQGFELLLPLRRPRLPRLPQGLERVLLHGHAVGVGPVEHRAGGLPRVFLRAGDQVFRGVLREERHGVGRHGHGRTAGSGGLAGS